MTPRLYVCLLLLLALVAACVSSSQGTTATSPAPCASAVRNPEPVTSELPEAQASVSPPSESTPQSAALRPGRYWFRNGECSALDVRTVRRYGREEFTEIAMQVPGGVHSSEGTVFYLVYEGALAAGGFRRSGLALEHRCNLRSDQPAVSSGAFGGVPLFDERASCEAQECTEDSCVARFELGDCVEAVATSARRLRHVRRAEEASRQRTLLRFQRLGRRGRLWLAGRSECVLAHAKREGAQFELRYSEAVEGGRTDTVANYTVAPLDLRAEQGSFTSIFSPGGGGVGGIGSSTGGSGIPLYFGDGVVLLGRTDLFFSRATCEANRAAE